MTDDALSFRECILHFTTRAAALLCTNFTPGQLKRWFHTPHPELENNTPYAVMLTFYGHHIPASQQLHASNLVAIEDLIFDRRW